MATKLALVFMTDQNKKVRLSISSPKQPADPAAIATAQQAIVGKNVFAFSQGQIVKAMPAEETQTDTTTIS
jgi:hypothetical protein